jgi:hypothetical protein
MDFFELRVRDENGSDRIISLPHPHPYFFVKCGAELILHGCRIWCGVKSVAEWMRKIRACIQF